MFFYDPFYIVILVVGGILVFLPQQWVKNTYRKYLKQPSSRGFTGAKVAESILRQQGVLDVQVEAVAGFLSDHYDPRSKRVRLSEENYHGKSVAAIAVAAHEVGHAIQHSTGYVPLVIRSNMVPMVNVGSGIGPWLLMIAIFLGASSQIMPDWAWMLGWIGVILFGAGVAFHIVTLPVEINASLRALRILEGGTYLARDEMDGAKKVLTAAAMTYVATALYALIQLLYFVMRLMGSRRG